jgi:hypothetical protein
MSEYVYSQDYTGRRYYYGCKRPVGVGHYPTSRLIIETPPPTWPLYRPHGIILAYTEPLSAEDISRYELRPVNAYGEPILTLELDEKTIVYVLEIVKELESRGVASYDQDEAMSLRLALASAYSRALRGRGR